MKRKTHGSSGLRQAKAWLYLLPTLAFLGVFMVYPLVDVLIYSFEEGYNSASQTMLGVGWYNYAYVLHDPYFLQAVKNTLSWSSSRCRSPRRWRCSYRWGCPL